ncbi:O-antigen ligase family protein [Devosia sp. MC521]|uniref:O-antigen ligase family protein n=1 Tax=Devosia sp. MC521 TaxID=2759954 RepID=UPI0015FE1EB1|nr:O-antigen ligase family protein [Devosia sp. MC521]MBJ6989220.1 O-antigen ligase family protein [Devosia sp. MC521]QMW63340.1 O-antigen ligase family protein [Devosia sp. MC521]
MTDIPTPLAPSRSSTAAQIRSSRPNSILAFCLVLLTAAAPIPLGANGPVAWCLNAGLVSVIGFAYALTLLLNKQALRVGISSLGAETILAVLLGGFILFQTVPATMWGGTAALTDVDGNSYPVAQLSAAAGVTVLSALNYAAYVVFFFLVLQISANRNRALVMAELAFAAIIAHAVFGLIALTLWNDSLLFFEKWAYHGVAVGTFVNRNTYGTFLAIGFVLGVGLTLRAALSRRNERGQRLPRADEKFVWVGLQVVGTILIFAALLASQSRMGLGAAIAGATVVVLIASLKTKLAQRQNGLLGLLAFAAIAGVALFVYGGGTLDRLGSTEVDADVRQLLYIQVLQMIENHWLWGTGAGTFELVYPLYHRWPVSPDLIWDKAHNSYLTMWSELGIIFGSVPLLIFAALGTRLIILITQRRDDWWLPTLSLASIIVVGVHSLVDFSMEIQGVVFMLLFVVGLGLDFRTKSTTSQAQGEISK